MAKPKFEDLIAAKELTPERQDNLEKYLKSCAEAAEKTVDELKPLALANFDDFWEKFLEWEREPGTLEEVAQECAPTEVTIIKEVCKVYITDAEYKAYALQMAEAGRDISRAEDELAAVKSRYKSRIDAAVARRNEISSIISMGWEDRPVDCQLFKDYRAGEIYKVRLDTGEEISRRPMTNDERQRGLDFMENQKATEGAEGDPAPAQEG